MPACVAVELISIAASASSLNLVLSILYPYCEAIGALLNSSLISAIVDRIVFSMLYGALISEQHHTIIYQKLLHCNMVLLDYRV
jgi:hypothetical protein